MAFHPNGRHARLETLLQTRGNCAVEELARELGVSAMTIRRDLDALARRGKAIRTHGGATLGRKVLFEFEFLKRVSQREEAKASIAAAAARLVQPGQSVLMDSGTTTLAVARALPGIERLTVITTSLPIAAALQYAPGIKLLLLGGYVRPDAPDLSGALTEANLESLQADLGFIGTDAIDAQGNLYSESVEVARLLGKMSRAARAAYVVADSSKLGRTALMRSGNLGRVSGLITDDDGAHAARRRLERLGFRILVGMPALNHRPS